MTTPAARTYRKNPPVTTIRNTTAPAPKNRARNSPRKVSRRCRCGLSSWSMGRPPGGLGCGFGATRLGASLYPPVWPSNLQGLLAGGPESRAGEAAPFNRFRPGVQPLTMGILSDELKSKGGWRLSASARRATGAVATMTYRNLAELHRRQAERLGPRPAVRFKRPGLYHDLTWEQYRADSLACAAALAEAGIAPGDRVGLVSEN